MINSYKFLIDLFFIDSLKLCLKLCIIVPSDSSLEKVVPNESFTAIFIDITLRELQAEELLPTQVSFPQTLTNPFSLLIIL